MVTLNREVNTSGRIEGRALTFPLGGRAAFLHPPFQEGSGWKPGEVLG